ncbi:MAG: NTP transferase domain-containing protein [Candidatus Omnitrophica bacterium]|nr:NTP transferase domain-containing protein [Candidatus Omnitrophota bacterium]
MLDQNGKENSRNKTPLYGLVLAGGRSTRMKEDKSLLKYHGKSQTEHCFGLLSKLCERVFVSNRKDQSELPGHKAFPQIHDTFLNMGPLDGILSAMAKYSHAAWLVLACDLPFVDENVLAALIKKRDPLKIATAYRSTNDDLPEPLCAIYEPRSISSLLKFLTDGYTCPRKILINSDIHLIEQDRKVSLENINNPEEYQSVYDALQSQTTNANGPSEQ